MWLNLEGPLQRIVAQIDGDEDKVQLPSDVCQDVGEFSRVIPLPREGKHSCGIDGSAHEREQREHVMAVEPIAAFVWRRCRDNSGANAVLIIDPFHNSSDTTTLGGLGSAAYKWRSITYVEMVGKLFAAPFEADAVLIIDPIANTTDTTTLAGLGWGGNKWCGITFVETVGRLYTAPATTTSALIVDFAVDAGVLLPFRLVAELTNRVTSAQAAMSSLQAVQSSTEAALVSTHASAHAAISSTEAALASTQAVLVSAQALQSSTESSLVTTQSALSSTRDALLSTEAEVSSLQVALASMQTDVTTVGDTVCSRPLCAAGTRADNGTCVPDCSELRR
jgi:hypothetical protein